MGGSRQGRGDGERLLLHDLLATISERGRSLIERREPRPAGEQRAALLVDLAEALLSRRGEASGVAIAGEILRPTPA